MKKNIDEIVRKPAEGSPEMERFDELVGAVWGGWHHIAKVKWYRPTCCEVWLHGSLSTFDYNAMTLLVVVAHDLKIRAEARRNRGFTVLLELRAATAKRHAMTEAHPSLERHVQAIREYRRGNEHAYSEMYREMEGSE